MLKKYDGSPSQSKQGHKGKLTDKSEAKGSGKKQKKDRNDNRDDEQLQEVQSQQNSKSDGEYDQSKISAKHLKGRSHNNI